MALFSICKLCPTVIGLYNKYMVIIYLAVPGVITYKVFVAMTLIFSLYYKFHFLFFWYLFTYLAALGLRYSIWDLVPWPGIEPRPPALGTWSLSHWATLEVPNSAILKKKIRFYLWLTYRQRNTHPKLPLFQITSASLAKISLFVCLFF